MSGAISQCRSSITNFIRSRIGHYSIAIHSNILFNFRCRLWNYCGYHHEPVVHFTKDLPTQYQVRICSIDTSLSARCNSRSESLFLFHGASAKQDHQEHPHARSGGVCSNRRSLYSTFGFDRRDGNSIVDQRLGLHRKEGRPLELEQGANGSDVSH